ncbi:hypothetical protein FQA39_LY00489 [Lamprigera yunnana]|nr:hypothetical protein FQA39_LY00489 [Lamprigera yunnana]
MSITGARANTVKILKTVRFLCGTPTVFNERQGTTSGSDKLNTSATESAQIPNVPGLSNDVVQFGDDPVGPGASKATGYYDAEKEMLKYRLPQPTSLH